MSRLYLGPADDFAVCSELGAVEDLDTGYRLHGLPVDWADDAEQTHKRQLTNEAQVSKSWFFVGDPNKPLLQHLSPLPLSKALTCQLLGWSSKSTNIKASSRGRSQLIFFAGCFWFLKLQGFLPSVWANTSLFFNGSWANVKWDLAALHH